MSDLPDPWTQDRHWILSSVGAVTARSPAIQPSSLLGCVFQLPASNHPRSISTGFLSCVERNIAGHAAERSLPREVWARRTVDQCRKRAAILPTSAGPRAGPRAGPASRGGQPALTARPRHPARDITTRDITTGLEQPNSYGCGGAPNRGWRPVTCMAGPPDEAAARYVSCGSRQCRSSSSRSLITVATSPLVTRSLPAPLRSAGAAGGLRPLARHRHVRHRAPQDDRSLWADEGQASTLACLTGSGRDPRPGRYVIACAEPSLVSATPALDSSRSSSRLSCLWPR